MTTKLRKKAEKAENTAVILEKEFSAYQAEMEIAERQMKADLQAEKARIIRERAFDAEIAERQAKAKAMQGRTINGARPVRKNSKLKRYEKIRFNFKDVKSALIHLFCHTDYASGDAASVIRAMGANLNGGAVVIQGKGFTAQEIFDRQSNYKRGKSMYTWARNELRCLGIIDRDDLLNAMVTGLME